MAGLPSAATLGAMLHGPSRRPYRPGAFLLNSWGANAHHGPQGVGHPSPAGFWADAEVVDGMLREGDSWAFSQFAGFPARKLDWQAMTARK